MLQTLPLISMLNSKSDFGPIEPLPFDDQAFKEQNADDLVDLIDAVNNALAMTDPSDSPPVDNLSEESWQINERILRGVRPKLNAIHFQGIFICTGDAWRSLDHKKSSQSVGKFHSRKPSKQKNKAKVKQVVSIANAQTAKLADSRDFTAAFMGPSLADGRRTRTVFVRCPQGVSTSATSFKKTTSIIIYVYILFSSSSPDSSCLGCSCHRQQF
jgi:hypothetical protein